MVQFFGNTQPGQMLQVPQQAQRSRALAQQLRQQALTPDQGQMVSGHYVGPNIASAISKLGLGYLSGKFERSAQEQEEAFKQQQQQYQTEFNRAIVGQPGAGPQRPMGQRVQALAQAGNPLARNFMTSQALRGVEQQQALDTFAQQEQIKAQLTPEKLPTGIMRDPQTGQRMIDPLYLQLQTQVGAAKAPRVDVRLGGGADSAQGEKFYNELDKQSADMFVKASDRGLNANTKLTQLNRLGDLLEQSGSGFGTAARLYASDFGLELGENVGEAQAARALINKLVPEQRAPGSGPMSDADLELFKQSLPRIINTQGGNDLILQTLRGIAMYDNEVGKIADQVIARQVSPEQGREMMRNLENPLETVRTMFGPSKEQKSMMDAPQGVDQADWDFMTSEQKRQYMKMVGGQ